MTNPFGLRPGPVLRPPPSIVGIAARLDEFEEGRIRDIVALNGEGAESAIAAGRSLSHPNARSSRSRPR